MVRRYGIVLKKLDLTEDALKVMQEAVNKEPLHWGAWLELSSLCTEKEIVRLFWQYLNTTINNFLT